MWARELADLRTWLHATNGAVAVAGDFNATLDHWQFRSLVSDGSNGYRDAVVMTGDAWRRTFSSGEVVPAIIAVDHIVLKGPVRSVSLQTPSLRASDHRTVLGLFDWVG